MGNLQNKPTISVRSKYFSTAQRHVDFRFSQMTLTRCVHVGSHLSTGSHKIWFQGIKVISFIYSSIGILHKGNGENVFLSQQPPVISTVMGNGFYRSVPCGPTCSGAARDMMLFAPVALASGPDGSLYVGDFNFVRRVHPDGYTRTILELK